jgi:hypothetical protein
VRSERITAVLVLALVVVFVLGGDITTCPLAGLLGIPCPSCGLTRATLALTRGDVRRAYALHPGVFAVLGYMLVASVVGARWRQRPILGRCVSAAGIALIVGLTLLWLARFCGSFGGPVPVYPWRWAMWVS